MESRTRQYFQSAKNRVCEQGFVQKVRQYQDRVLCYDSNNDIQIIDEHLTVVQKISQQHGKRINDAWVDDNVLFSCSNDGTIKLFDLKSNQLVHQFKTQNEVYSISKSQHILAAGSEGGKLLFMDLKKMKQRQIFKDSHQEDVTSVEFNDDYFTYLMSCSTDGMLCMFDLNKQNEEDAIYSMMRVEQPLQQVFSQHYKQCLYSRFGRKCCSESYCSCPECKIYKVQKNEFNSKYLVTFDKSSSCYVLGDKQILQFYDLEQKEQMKVHLGSSNSVSSCCFVGEQLFVADDSGQLAVYGANSQQTNVMADIEIEEQNMFYDEEIECKSRPKQFQKKQQYNYTPF